MDHPKMMQWDEKLKTLFDEVDDFLENKYAGIYNLHPKRAPRGQTSNKEQDGLFNVGASFSAGFGSEFGRGYVISVHLSTLDNIDSSIIQKIHQEVADFIKMKFPIYFPGRQLKIDWDRNILKIHGDLSLGSL